MYDVIITFCTEVVKRKQLTVEDLRNLDVILEQLREEYKCEVISVEAKKVNVKK